MRKVVTIFFLALLAAACSKSPDPKPEILGVRLGMSREAAHARLRAIGRLEKEERKQQEVWRLNDEPSYTHLIVAYNKDYTSVRYVTAVANEQGRRVRYADMIDTRRARAEVSPATHVYTQEVPARAEQPAFIVKAIGTDPENLKYFSVERAD